MCQNLLVVGHDDLCLCAVLQGGEEAGHLGLVGEVLCVCAGRRLDTACIPLPHLIHNTKIQQKSLTALSYLLHNTPPSRSCTLPNINKLSLVSLLLICTSTKSTYLYFYK